MTKRAKRKMAETQIRELKRAINCVIHRQDLFCASEKHEAAKAYQHLNTLRNSLHRYLVQP